MTEERLKNMICESYLKVAMDYIKEGKPEEAIYCGIMAVRMDPDDDHARRAAQILAVSLVKDLEVSK